LTSQGEAKNKKVQVREEEGREDVETQEPTTVKMHSFPSTSVQRKKEKEINNEGEGTGEAGQRKVERGRASKGLKSQRARRRKVKDRKKKGKEADTPI